MKHKAKYVFGDSELAARRLELLSEIFQDSTRPFFQAIAAKYPPPRLALDLGCGPGFTTRLLAEILEPERVIGFDNSGPFIALARTLPSPRIAYRQHDVTDTPFPGQSADLLFCRFLTSHLTAPEVVIAKWASHLRPQSLLAIEETEWIQMQNPVFRQYIDMSIAMMESQKNTLYIGPLLDALHFGETLLKRFSEVRTLKVANHRAARMFLMNFQTWKSHEHIRKNYSPETIEALEQKLKALAQPSEKTEIEWGLRQIVFEKIRY